MQLHPLVRGGVLPALGLGGLVDAVRLQHQIAVVEPPHGKPPLNLEPLALLHLADDGLGLLPLHKPGDPDGAGEVGDIEAHHPGLPPGKFPVLHVEHLALHHHAAHVQGQLPHGDGLLFPADLAVDLLDPLFSAAGGGGVRPQDLPAHGRHLGLQALGLPLRRGGGLCRRLLGLR